MSKNDRVKNTLKVLIERNENNTFTRSIKKLFGNTLSTGEEADEAKLSFREVGDFIPKKSGQPKSSKKRKKL